MVWSTEELKKKKWEKKQKKCSQMCHKVMHGDRATKGVNACRVRAEVSSLMDEADMEEHAGCMEASSRAEESILLLEEGKLQRFPGFGSHFTWSTWLVDIPSKRHCSNTEAHFFARH